MNFFPSFDHLSTADALLDSKHEGALAQSSDDEIFCIEACDDPFENCELITFWNAMLATSSSEDKIYQTPGFFRFLQQTATSSWTRPILLLIRGQDGRLAGLVPARATYHDLLFRAGRHNLKLQLPAVQVLGSVMVVPPGAAIQNAIFSYLLSHFEGARLIVMQRVPQELYNVQRKTITFTSSVVQGWQACHTMPLPDSFDAYLQRFSSKKRYNLSRQVRLLAKEAGVIELVRVDRRDQCGALVQAIQEIAPGQLGQLDAAQNRYAAMADHGLVLSYILRCNGRNLAVVLGSCSADTWYVYKVYCTRGYGHLSLGTSALHLALEDVIGHRGGVTVDFGYGTPAYEFSSTNVIRMRGYVVCYHRFGLTALQVKCLHAYDRMYDAGVALVKRHLRKRHRVVQA